MGKGENFVSNQQDHTRWMAAWCFELGCGLIISIYYLAIALRREFNQCAEVGSGLSTDPLSWETYGLEWAFLTAI